MVKHLLKPTLHASLRLSRKSPVSILTPGPAPNASPAPQMTTPYIGPGKVLVGNGPTLHISAIGSSVIPTHSKPLHLHNMLYTHCVTKNLLYVL